MSSVPLIARFDALQGWDHPQAYVFHAIQKGPVAHEVAHWPQVAGEIALPWAGGQWSVLGWMALDLLLTHQPRAIQWHALHAWLNHPGYSGNPCDTGLGFTDHDVARMALWGQPIPDALWTVRTFQSLPPAPFADVWPLWETLRPHLEPFEQGHLDARRFQVEVHGLVQSYQDPAWHPWALGWMGELRLRNEVLDAVLDSPALSKAVLGPTRKSRRMNVWQHLRQAWETTASETDQLRAWLDGCYGMAAEHLEDHAYKKADPATLLWEWTPNEWTLDAWLHKHPKAALGTDAADARRMLLLEAVSAPLAKLVQARFLRDTLHAQVPPADAPRRARM